MNSSAVKPWVATSDADDVAFDAALGGDENSPSGVAGAKHRSDSSASRSQSRRGGAAPPLLISPRWAFIPLAAAFVLTVLAVVGPGRDSSDLGRLTLQALCLLMSAIVLGLAIGSQRRQVSGLSEVVRGELH